MQQKNLLTILCILMIIEDLMFCSILDLYFNSFSIMRSYRPWKVSKDQKLDAHLCSDRSESSLLVNLVLLTHVIISLDIIFVLTTLITLSKIHITQIFVSPYLSHGKLSIHALLIYKKCFGAHENWIYMFYEPFTWVTPEPSIFQ